MTTLTEKSSMKDIIARAKELDIVEFIHEGVSTKVKTRLSKDYKPSLLDAIQKKELDLEPLQVAETEETPEYAESDNEKVEEIKTYVRDGIKDMVVAESDPNKMDELFTLMGTVPTNTVTRLLDIGSTPNTLTKYRSMIFSDLEREFEALPKSKSKDRILRFYTTVRNNVYAAQAIKEKVALKAETSRINVKERKANRTDINPDRLIVWAVETLQKIHRYNPTYWKPVVQALKVLTGRRTSEILSSGMFAPSLINGCLLFKGQNKKHSQESFESETPIIIPIIGGHTDLVLQGMQWLNSSGKRILAEDNTWDAQRKANTLVNKMMGKYLSEYCRGMDGFHMKWYDLVDAQTNWDGKKKPDCTRDIYTQIIGQGYFEIVSQGLTETLDFLGGILGHSDKGKSIIKYDIDFKVNFEDIEKYLKGIDLKSIPVNQ